MKLAFRTLGLILTCSFLALMCACGTSGSSGNQNNTTYTPPTVTSVTVTTDTLASLKEFAVYTFDATVNEPNVGVTIASYAWDFGDGTAKVTTTAGVATHAYAATGNYTVTVTATDSKGNTSGNYTQSDVVVPGPNPFTVTTVAPAAALNLQVQLGLTTSYTFDFTVAVSSATSLSYNLAGITLSPNDSTITDTVGAITQKSGTTNEYTAIVSFPAAATASSRTFTPTVQVTDTTKVVASGQIAFPAITITSAPTSAPPPVVTLAASPAVIVPSTVNTTYQGVPIAFTATASDPQAPNMMYTWTFDDGGTGDVSQSTALSLSHTYNTPGNYTVTFLADTGLPGGQKTVQMEMIILADTAPNLAIATSPTQYYVGVPITFTATDKVAGQTPTYTWDFGDTGSGTGATITHTFLGAGINQVTLTANDGNGGVTTQILDVTVLAGVPPASYAVTGPTGNLYQSKAYAFTATAPLPHSGNPVTSFIWNWGDGSSLQTDAKVVAGSVANTYSDTVSHSFPIGAPITANVTVQAVDSNGAVGPASPNTAFPVVTPLFPTATFTVPAAPALFTLPVNAQATVSFTFAVTNPNGATGTFLPASGIVFYPLGGANPVTAPVTANGDGTYTASYAYGAAASAPATSTFTPSVQATDALGITGPMTSSPSVTIVTATTIVPPVATLAAAPAVLVAGTTNTTYQNVPITFTATASDPQNPSMTYSWSFGDGGKGDLTASTLLSVAHTYATPGAYTVTFTANTGIPGGVKTIQMAVAILPETGPNISFTTNPATIYVGLPVTFTAVNTTPGSNPTYTWQSFGDNSAPQTGASVVHTFQASGPDQVILSADDGKGGVATSIQTLTILPDVPPLSSAVTGPSGLLLQNRSYAFTATGIKAATGYPITGFIWSWNDGSPAQTDTTHVTAGTNSTYIDAVNHSFPVGSSSSTYNITVQAVDSVGSVGPVSPTTAFTVVPTTLPVTTFLSATPAAATANLVAGSSNNYVVVYKLSVTNPNGTGFLPISSIPFTSGDPLAGAAAPVGVDNHDGTYTFTVTFKPAAAADSGRVISPTVGVVTDGGLVQGVATAGPALTITTLASDVPVVSLASVPASPAYTGSPVTFTATVTDPKNVPMVYSWNFGDGHTVAPTSGAAALVAANTFATEGVYTVTFTADNGQAGGKVVTTLSLTVLPNPTTVTVAVTRPVSGTINQNQMVSFTGTGAVSQTGDKITAMIWNFGDGTSYTDSTSFVAGASVTSSVTHTYLTAGTYLVTVQANVTTAQPSVPGPGFITVLSPLSTQVALAVQAYPSPVAALIVDPAVPQQYNVTLGAPGVLAALPVQSGASYLWTASNGQISGSTRTNQVIVTPNAGSTTVGLNCAVTTGSGTTTSTATLAVVPATTTLISAPANANAGTTGLVASVPYLANATYAWTITNGTITSGGTLTSGGAATSGLGTSAITFTAGSNLAQPVVLGCTVTGVTPVLLPGSANVTLLPAGATLLSAPANISGSPALGTVVTYFGSVSNTITPGTVLPVLAPASAPYVYNQTPNPTTPNSGVQGVTLLLSDPSAIMLSQELVSQTRAGLSTYAFEVFYPAATSAGARTAKASLFAVVADPTNSIFYNSGAPVPQAITLTTAPNPDNPPVVNLTSAPAFAASNAVTTWQGDAVTFTVAATDPDSDPMTYTWAFGDGSTQTFTNLTSALTQSHIFVDAMGNPLAGVFPVSLMADDGRGGVKIADLTMNVLAYTPPTISVTPLAGNLYKYQPVTFTATGTTYASGPVTVLFNFGDGGGPLPASAVTLGTLNTTTNLTPFTATLAHNFTTGGQSQVTATVNDLRSPVVTSAVLPVDVLDNNPPVAQVTTPAGNLYQNKPVQFTATATTPHAGTIQSFLWSFGDGTTGTSLPDAGSGSTRTSTAPAHSYANVGTYPVQVQAVDSLGSQGPLSSPVSFTVLPALGPNPPASAVVVKDGLSGATVATPGPLYQNKVYTFTFSAGTMSAENVAIGSYILDFGDGTQSAPILAAAVGTPVSHTYLPTVAGPVSVRVLALDVNGLAGAYGPAAIFNINASKPQITFLAPASAMTYNVTAANLEGPVTVSYLIKVTNPNSAMALGAPVFTTGDALGTLVGTPALDASGNALIQVQYASGATPVPPAISTSRTATPTVTVTDALGVSSLVTAPPTITIDTVTAADTPPVVNLTATPALLAGPDTTWQNVPVTFTGVAVDADADPLLYTWQINGVTVSGPSPLATALSYVHTFPGSNAGPVAYAVSLTADDGRNEVNAARKIADLTINVLPDSAPIPVITAPLASSTLYKYQVVNFTATVSGQNAGVTPILTWNFGDGSPAQTGLTAKHQFTTAGPVTVTLTADDGQGNHGQGFNGSTLPTTTVALNILDNAPAVAMMTTPAATLYQGVGGTFTAQASIPAGGTVASFLWFFGDGAAPVSSSPIGSGNTVTTSLNYTYPTPFLGAAQVQVVAIDGNGGQSAPTPAVTFTIISDIGPVAPAVVAVKDGLSGAPVATPGPLFQNKDYTFTFGAGTPSATGIAIKSYILDFGDGTQSAAILPAALGTPIHHTYAPTAAGPVNLRVQATDLNGLPGAFGPATTFTINASKPLITFLAPASAQTYNVTAANAEGPVSVYYQINVTNPNSTLALGAPVFTAGDALGTVIGTPALDAGGNALIQVQYAAGTAPVPPATSTSRTATPTVTVTDALGVSSLVTAPPAITLRTVTGPDTPPVVNLTPVPAYPAGNPTTTWRGDAVTFTATATDADGDPMLYTWNFGDGTPAQVVTPQTSQLVMQHTFPDYGAWPVSLTADDGRGQVKIADLTMSILDYQVPTISVSQTAPSGDPLKYQQVTFTAATSSWQNAPVTVTWDFGDGSGATGSPTQHTFVTAGKTLVTATVTDGRSPAVTSLPIAVQVDDHSPAVAVITTPAASLEQNVQATFTAYGIDPNPAHLLKAIVWNFGDGIYYTDQSLTRNVDGSFGSTVTHTYKSPFSGNVTVQAQPLDSQGVLGTLSPGVNFLVQTVPPTAQITTYPTGAVKQNQSVNFVGTGATSVPGATIASMTWDFGDGTTLVDSSSWLPPPSSSVTSRVSHTYQAPYSGQAVVTVRATDSLGMSGTSAPVIVAVATHPFPVPIFITDPAVGTSFNVTTGTNGVNASVPSIAGATYAWTISNGTIASGAGTSQVTVTASAPGTLSLGCTVKDASGNVVGSAASASLAAVPAGTPVLTAPANAPPNTTGLVASVPAQANATYAWTINGVPVAADPGSNAILFSTPASGSVALSCVVTVSGTAAPAANATVAVVTGLTPVITVPANLTVGESQGTLVTYFATVSNPNYQATDLLTYLPLLAPGTSPSVTVPGVTFNPGETRATVQAQWVSTVSGTSTYVFQTYYPADASQGSRSVQPSLFAVDQQGNNSGVPIALPVTITSTSTVNTSPVATLSAAPSLAAGPNATWQNVPVTFLATATDADRDPMVYTWNFGDATSQIFTNLTSALTQSHTYSSPGAYQVSLTADDGRGPSKIADLTLNVLANTEPSFISLVAVPASPYKYQTVTFTAATSSYQSEPVTITWDFGDGTSAVGSPVTHVYTTAGMTLVSATVTDGKGGSTTSLPITVDVLDNAPPVAAITSPAATLNQNQVYTFTAQASDPDPGGKVTQVLWTFGDGTTYADTGASVTSSGLSNVTHTYTSLGVMPVSVVATDALGIQGPQSPIVNFTVQASTHPVAAFITDPGVPQTYNVTLGTTGTLASVPMVAGASYAWTIANGTLSSGQGTNQVNFVPSGASAVTLGVAVTTTPVTGFTTGSPTITFPASIITVGATGLTASVPSVAGYTYSWSITNGTITAGALTNAITFSAGTLGPLQLTCVSTRTSTGVSTTGTAQLTVTSTNQGSATITTNPVGPVLTAPANVLLNATGLVASVPPVANASYAWTIAGGTITDPPLPYNNNAVLYTASGPGPVQLSCTVTPPSGAPVVYTATSTIVTPGTPVITVPANITTSPNLGTVVTFFSTVTNPNGTAALPLLAPGSVPTGTNPGVAFDPGDATAIVLSQQESTSADGSTYTYLFQVAYPAASATGSRTASASLYAVDASVNHRTSGTPVPLPIKVLTQTAADALPTATLVATPSLSAGANATWWNDPVTFTATAADSDNDPMLYTWNFGDGTVITSNLLSSLSQTHTYLNSAGGTYPVTFTADDGRGGVRVADLTMNVLSGYRCLPTVSTPVVAVPAGTPLNSFYKYEPLTFTSTVTPCTGDTVTVTFAFGDGTVVPVTATNGNTYSTTYTYQSAGPATVIVTATDSNGSVATKATSVNILDNSQPTAVITDALGVPLQQGTTLNQGAPATFYASAKDPDTGGSITSFIWTFGDGTSVTVNPSATSGQTATSQVSHTYSAPWLGTAAVTVQAVDALGLTGPMSPAVNFNVVLNVTTSPTIVVTQPASFPASVFALEPATVSFVLTDPTPNPITTYSINWGDNTAPTTATLSNASLNTGKVVTVSHAYANTAQGLNLVTVTAWDILNAQVVASSQPNLGFQVKFNNLPTATIITPLGSGTLDLPTLTNGTVAATASGTLAATTVLPSGMMASAYPLTSPTSNFPIVVVPLNGSLFFSGTATAPGSGEGIGSYAWTFPNASPSSSNVAAPAAPVTFAGVYGQIVGYLTQFQVTDAFGRTPQNPSCVWVVVDGINTETFTLNLMYRQLADNGASLALAPVTTAANGLGASVQIHQDGYYNTYTIGTGNQASVSIPVRANVPFYAVIPPVGTDSNEYAARIPGQPFRTVTAPTWLTAQNTDPALEAQTNLAASASSFSFANNGLANPNWDPANPWNPTLNIVMAQGFAAEGQTQVLKMLQGEVDGIMTPNYGSGGSWLPNDDRWMILPSEPSLNYPITWSDNIDAFFQGIPINQTFAEWPMLLLGIEADYTASIRTQAQADSTSDPVTASAPSPGSLGFNLNYASFHNDPGTSPPTSPSAEFSVEAMQAFRVPSNSTDPYDLSASPANWNAASAYAFLTPTPIKTTNPGALSYFSTLISNGGELANNSTSAALTGGLDGLQIPYDPNDPNRVVLSTPINRDLRPVQSVFSYAEYLWSKVWSQPIVLNTMELDTTDTLGVGSTWWLLQSLPTQGWPKLITGAPITPDASYFDMTAKGIKDFDPSATPVTFGTPATATTPAVPPAAPSPTGVGHFYWTAFTPAYASGASGGLITRTWLADAASGNQAPPQASDFSKLWTTASTSSTYAGTGWGFLPPQDTMVDKRLRNPDGSLASPAALGGYRVTWFNPTHAPDGTLVVPDFYVIELTNGPTGAPVHFMVPSNYPAPPGSGQDLTQNVASPIVTDARYYMPSYQTSLQGPQTYLLSDTNATTPSSFNASITNTGTSASPVYVLNIDSAPLISGTIAVGDAITGTDIVPGTTIAFVKNAPTNQVGTYWLSQASSGTLTDNQGASTFFGSITGSSASASTFLTVSAAGPSATGIQVGDALTGTGIPAGTTVAAQLTGASGQAGTYTVSATATTGAITITDTTSLLTFSGSITGTTLTVTANPVGGLPSSRGIVLNDAITGPGITAGTTIAADLTGSGQTGTYTVSPSSPATGTITITDTTGAEVFQGSVTGTTLTVVTPPYATLQTSRGLLVSDILSSTNVVVPGTTIAAINVNGGVTTYQLNSTVPSTQMTDVTGTTRTFMGSIADNVLTVSSVPAPADVLQAGDFITGAGVLPGTKINAIITGTGFEGTYSLTQSTAGTVTDTSGSLSFTASVSNNVMTVTSLPLPVLQVGDPIGGPNVLPGTTIASFVSGTNGGAGVYKLSQSLSQTLVTDTTANESFQASITNNVLTVATTPEKVQQVQVGDSIQGAGLTPGTFTIGTQIPTSYGTPGGIGQYNLTIVNPGTFSFSGLSADSVAPGYCWYDIPAELRPTSASTLTVFAVKAILRTADPNVAGTPVSVALARPLNRPDWLDAIKTVTANMSVVPSDGTNRAYAHKIPFNFAWDIVVVNSEPTPVEPTAP